VSALPRSRASQERRMQTPAAQPPLPNASRNHTRAIVHSLVHGTHVDTSTAHSHAPTGERVPETRTPLSLHALKHIHAAFP
jgi:hypothetical protein